MKSFFSFVLGLIIPLFISVAVLGWYLYQKDNPNGATTIVLQENSPANGNLPGKVEPGTVFPGKSAGSPANDSAQNPPQNPAPNIAKVESVFLDGMVLFPPLLHQRLLQEKGVALISLSAYVGNLLDKDAKQVIQLSEDIYLTRVPYSYRVRIFRAMIPYLSKLQKFDLTMRAVVCFGSNVAKPLEPMQLWPQCWNVTTPSFVGLNKFRLDLANATRSSDGELTIKPPPIVLSNWYRELDPKACERSGKSIEGMIYPTPAFNALKRSSHRAILLAIPKTRHPLPPPYRGDGEQGKLSAADLSNMERFGIVRKPINLNPDASTQFSLKVPPIGFDYYYTLVVNFCREGESDDACAASAFPFRAAKVPRENSDLFRLIPGQFEVAHCGMKKHNFYLHHNGNEKFATEEDVRVANPPEVIDGLLYN